eukprot:COSAG06_NODE_222_length_19858_cov_7.238372_2_plen_139_part_00
MAAMGGSLGLLLDGDWVRKHPFLAERLHSCKTNGWRAEIQARAAMVGNEIETREREQIKTATLARTELPEAMRPGAACATHARTHGHRTAVPCLDKHEALPRANAVPTRSFIDPSFEQRRFVPRNLVERQGREEDSTA